MNVKPVRAVARVGFVGLGNMGGPMAANLVAGGFEVSVFDIRLEAVSELVAQGAAAASSVAELARSMDMLCLCVLTDEQVRELVLGQSGILVHGHPGLIVAVHGTMSPVTAEHIAAVCGQAGITVLDAPVTGASMASKAGTLTLMVGGPESGFAAALPVFECVGREILYLGGVGKPQAAKLANNIMAVCNEAIVMEAIKFGAVFGLSREEVLRVAANGTGGSWAAEHYSYFENWPAEHPETSATQLPHRMTKDIRTAVTLAQDRMVNLPVTALCTQVIPAMYAARWGER